MTIVPKGFWIRSISRDDSAYPPQRSLTKKRRHCGSAHNSVPSISTPYATLMNACVLILIVGHKKAEKEFSHKKAQKSQNEILLSIQNVRLYFLITHQPL